MNVLRCSDYCRFNLMIPSNSLHVVVDLNYFISETVFFHPYNSSNLPKAQYFLHLSAFRWVINLCAFGTLTATLRTGSVSRPRGRSRPPWRPPRRQPPAAADRSPHGLRPPPRATRCSRCRSPFRLARRASSAAGAARRRLCRAGLHRESHCRLGAAGGPTKGGWKALPPPSQHGGRKDCKQMRPNPTLNGGKCEISIYEGSPKISQ